MNVWDVVAAALSAMSVQVEPSELSCHLVMALLDGSSQVSVIVSC